MTGVGGLPPSLPKSCHIDFFVPIIWHLLLSSYLGTLMPQ